MHQYCVCSEVLVYRQHDDNANNINFTIFMPKQRNIQVNQQKHMFALHHHLLARVEEATSVFTSDTSKPNFDFSAKPFL